MRYDWHTELPIQAFRPTGKRMTLEGGGKGAKTPDYAGAAAQQAQSSKEVTNMQNYANRPTQSTPWGQTSWNTSGGIDPATGQPVTKWEQTQTLSPELQAALNDQIAIQGGRSELAKGFLDRVQQEYSRPFDWHNLPAGGGYVQAERTTPTGANANLQKTGIQTNVDNTPIWRGIGTTGQQQNVNDYYLNTQGPQQTTASRNEMQFSGDRRRLEDLAFDRMRPEHQYQDEALRTRLANQGLTPGSMAYDRAMKLQANSQADERYKAVDAAGQEQSRMMQGLMGVQQQAFGQDAASRAAVNAALGQQFGQGLQAGQFTNQALQNLYNQYLGQGQFANAAAGQQFGQGLQQGQFVNQAQGQVFGQNQAALQAENAARQQAFSQNQAANSQNFNQAMQVADYENRMRQQAIAEQQQARGMSLNELNALMTGQQVTSPQMPSFTPAQAAQPLQALGAAQAQGANQPQGSDWGSLLGTGASIGMKMFGMP